MGNSEVDKGRRRFLTATATVVGGAGTVAGAAPFIATMAPSEKAKAIGAPVEVDISKLNPGEMIIEKWQGKPVWILRRTQEMLDDITAQDDIVTDPASDTDAQPGYAKNEYRSRESEYLVVIGLCTHLGCSPKFIEKGIDESPSAERGGFFCPCHGSRFDFAGRVFKDVPAPTNLVVPPYKFLTAERLVIGDDSEAV